MSPKKPTRPPPGKSEQGDRTAKQDKKRLEDELEEGLEETFPGSDTPSAVEPGT